MDLKREQLKKINLDYAPKVYLNYINSLKKNPSAIPRTYESFIKNVIRYGEAFQYGNSYVIGSYNSGLFLPSHFAPDNSREGIRIIKELSNYNNIVFITTNNLTPLLKKMGYLKTDLTLPMQFRGTTVYKDIIVSSEPLKSLFDGFIDKLPSDISDIKSLRTNLKHFLI